MTISGEGSTLALSCLRPVPLRTDKPVPGQNPSDRLVMLDTLDVVSIIISLIAGALWYPDEN